MGILGEYLYAARKRLGLSQEELAKRSGLQAGEISRFERGKRDPRVSTLEKLAAALEVEPWQLLKKADDKDGRASA
jgi:transcriptional regulator with XRE-family HTH domain